MYIQQKRRSGTAAEYAEPYEVHIYNYTTSGWIQL